MRRAEEKLAWAIVNGNPKIRKLWPHMKLGHSGWNVNWKPCELQCKPNMEVQGFGTHLIGRNHGKPRQPIQRRKIVMTANMLDKFETIGLARALAVVDGSEVIGLAWMKLPEYVMGVGQQRVQFTGENVTVILNLLTVGLAVQNVEVIGLKCTLREVEYIKVLGLMSRWMLSDEGLRRSIDEMPITRRSSDT